MPRTTLFTPVGAPRSSAQPATSTPAADAAPSVIRPGSGRADVDRFDGGTSRGAAHGPGRAGTLLGGTAPDGLGIVDVDAPEALSARFRDAPLGARIGSGGQKIAYELRDDPGLVISILKPITDDRVIAEEEDLLAQVERAGLPAAKHICQTTHGGRPASVMERYAEGSKTTVRNVGGCMMTVGRSRHLNQRSIDDLERIRQTMVGRNIRIADLQFLIAEDGAVVISDPLEVKVGTPPSRTNLKTIELLIAAARQSIADRGPAGTGTPAGGNPP